MKFRWHKVNAVLQNDILWRVHDINADWASGIIQPMAVNLSPVENLLKDHEIKCSLRLNCVNFMTFQFGMRFNLVIQ